MKKTLFISIVTFLLVLMPNSVSADELQNSETKQVNLFATKAGSYIVNVPVSVNISELSTSFSIQFKGDIGANDYLYIDIADTYLLKEDTTSTLSHADQTLTISEDKTTIGYIDIDEDYCEDATITVTVAHDELPAGNWSCNLPIRIDYKTGTN